MHRTPPYIRDPEKKIWAFLLSRSRSNCERCGFDGNTINTETLEFVRLEDDSISVNLTRNFESFILRLTEDHENAVKELRNE